MAGLRNDYDEILKVIRSKQNRIYYDLTAVVSIEGKQYDVLKVMQVVETENYRDDYCPSVTVALSFHADVYHRHIYPNRKRAKLLLSWKLMSELQDTALEGFKDITETFDMVAMDNHDLDMQSNPNMALDRSIIQTNFALIQPAISELKLVKVGGLFNNERAVDILRYMLGASSEALELPIDQKPRGVDFVEPDVLEPMEHICLRPGTELLSELPNELQRDYGGIYNHYCNIFLKSNQWYIFPIYNTERFNTTKRVAEIVVLPPNTAPGHERTYIGQGDKVLISVTGNTKQRDNSDINFQNHGNGVRFAKASDIWNYVKQSGNKSTAEKTNNMAEIKSVGRDSGLDNAVMSDRLVTDNVAREISKMSARQGYTMAVVWHNSMPRLIRPAMPVRLHVPVEGGSREHKATVLTVESITAPASAEMTSSRYITNSVLTLFVSL